MTDQSISILSSLSKAHKGRCLIHEIAHHLLHDPEVQEEVEEREDVKGRPDKSVIELEAESVSYIVSNCFGLDTSCYSFGYSRMGRKSSIERNQTIGARIQKTAQKLIDWIASTFEEETIEPVLESAI